MIIMPLKLYTTVQEWDDFYRDGYGVKQCRKGLFNFWWWCGEGDTKVWVNVSLSSYEGSCESFSDVNVVTNVSVDFSNDYNILPIDDSSDNKNTHADSHADLYWKTSLNASNVVASIYFFSPTVQIICREIKILFCYLKKCS